MVIHLFKIVNLIHKFNLIMDERFSSIYRIIIKIISEIYFKLHLFKLRYLILLEKI